MVQKYSKRKQKHRKYQNFRTSVDMLNRFVALFGNNLTDLVINLFELYGTVFPQSSYVLLYTTDSPVICFPKF